MTVDGSKFEILTVFQVLLNTELVALIVALFAGPVKFFLSPRYTQQPDKAWMYTKRLFFSIFSISSIIPESSQAQ